MKCLLLSAYTASIMSSFQNPSNDLRRAHAAWSIFEARLVAEALHSEDIQSTIRNDTLVGSIGLLPAGEVKVEVWVHKDDIERAERIVHAVLYSDGDMPVVGTHVHDAPTPEETPPATCPHCGAPREPGFDTCWKCSKAF